ncbi:carbamoyl phosphate synthase small subunit [Pediococcus claussenii]|uniref:Carbamoyl phosphate synthase small chain n=1 Tax=Pediococcus claussenii (strain ATCC BAA-344 / DSM 14800 / JCM 18046 / KCTC 3811 / LMG 21948 / P06) TaxID=701521 RepID=G8PBN4_PEDCP|nr:carbamoyl phosphate synthase small subunit [Pediococcus claussenii]AEV94783.1 carbamoyl-phosphate synthase, small subunit [Pediococcus claussenii ATCC BAA-344]ANZ69979.1 carbamoyl phosphate synthase small subunit [Pediococcus claussenii]ANZ71795.1 carbamoyl phosphate synthase small subunit [Pediococcus claussenii]KRN20962.1 carA protein [Pediococcus claussenii]
MKRYLLLEDGVVFEGQAIGANQTTTGELVFNTGMSGYQESLTDPSYSGQILMFTYPTIGNYGINSNDLESAKIRTRGIIVNELTRETANRKMRMTLEEYLAQQNIPGIKGIDTRAVTKHIREAGVMRAAILDEIKSNSLSTLQSSPVGHNQVTNIATKNAYPNPADGKRVVVIDFGLKFSILRELGKRNCDVIVMPPDSTADEIIKCNPDGVLLSNGPGDPSDIDDNVLSMIRTIQIKYPLFGICLGHQLFAMANGATAKKMKFGHRGFNHPVKNLESGRIDFTSQNHGYAVDKHSLKETELLVTHEEINDHTIEGLKHKKFNAFSVQFHPDAAPGPHDANDLFDQFIEMIEQHN